MGNWINKTFRKGKCVVAMVFNTDRRAKIKYLIPKNNSITIKGNSWVLNEDDMFLYKGIPAYVLTTKNAEPIKINPLNQKENFMSPQDYNTAISSRVAEQIFLSTKKGIDSGMISILVSGVLLVGLIVIAYFGNEYITQINTKIDEIRQILQIFGT
ncbi:MAG: hypothetical protein AB7V50_03145 [Vampirovibrionia bacterium]